MSFNAIRENKILAKISESTVAKHTAIVTKAEGNIKVYALLERGGLERWDHIIRVAGKGHISPEHCP